MVAPPENPPAAAPVAETAAAAAAPQSESAAPGAAPPAEPAEPASGHKLVKAVISGSLVRTFSSTMESRQAEVLSAHVARLLVWRLDLRRDVLPGDELVLLYEPRPAPEELRVLALVYHSKKLGEDFQAFFYKPEGAAYGRYFDAEGREIELRLKASPLDEYEQITERVNLAGRRHRGVDFKVDVGAEVKSPYRAQVVRRNWAIRLNGNCLELFYPENGRSALFLHLDSIEPTMRPGAKIEAGQVIARTGNTGRSTAPHLHYELHAPGGRLLDPFQAEETWRRQLEGKEREAFLLQRDRLLEKLK